MQPSGRHGMRHAPAISSSALMPTSSILTISHKVIGIEMPQKVLGRCRQGPAPNVLKRHAGTGMGHDGSARPAV